jgi:hypothetical protein
VRKSVLTASLLCGFLAINAFAAEEFSFPPPVKEHEWLKQFVGEWETESEASFGEGTPAIKCKGSMESKTLGGFWVVNEITSEGMGMPMSGIQTIGYDPKTKKYVGTWVDSATSTLWKYTGSVDETGKILTLEADGPNFLAGGKLTKFKDVYEFKSKDHIVSSSLMQGEDGKWATFMKGNIRRGK